MEANDLNFNSEPLRKNVSRIEKTINDRISIVGLIADAINLNYTSTTGTDVLFPPTSSNVAITSPFSSVVGVNSVVIGGNSSDWYVDAPNLQIEYRGNASLVDLYGQLVCRPNTSTPATINLSLFMKKPTDLNFIEVSPITASKARPDNTNQLMTSFLQTFAQVPMVPGTKFELRISISGSVALSHKIFDYAFTARPLDIVGSG